MSTSTGGRLPVTQPPLGPSGWARWAWRTLTSMRTALFLLLLLSIAAVPGSLFPQRSIDPGRVADYLAENPTTGAVLDRLSFFDVYTSPWFSAVYLLLVVSLVGCIVPRARLHWRDLRAAPPRAPARLERLDAFRRIEYPGPPSEALTAAARALRRHRYRVSSHDATSVSAESGYVRETGNLVFHVALCVVIVGVAAGHLFGWRGDVIVPVGQTFASSAGQYDTFSAGPLVDPQRLPDFTVQVDSMDVRFEERAGGAQFGAPRAFAASTTTTERPGAAPQEHTVSVNQPLSLAGAEVYLLGNGYAPLVTVRDAAGAVLYRERTAFLPQDNLYTSVGAVKVPAASPKQLGFSGVFLPTAEPTFKDGPVSLFPDLKNPELALSVWEGDLFPGGRPQSVRTLNTTDMTAVTKADGQPLLIRLRPGDTYELPGDRGSITFESVDRFAGLSVRADPGKGLTLAAALLAIAGLVASLLVRRRRLFVRAVPDGSTTLVVIGGLAKNADPGLDGAVQSLADELTRQPAATSPQHHLERTER